MISLFCIYNKTLKQYYSPNIMEHTLEAVKAAMYDVVNATNDNYIKRAPANYAIYQVGEFDSKTGKLNSMKPKLVLELADLKEVSE